MTHDEMKDALVENARQLTDEEYQEYELDAHRAQAFSTVAEYWFMKGWIARGA